MTKATNTDPVLEQGWLLEGTDGDGGSVRLAVGTTELSRAYLGLTIGRHPELCERVIDDATVSRRHARLGLNEGRLFIEDLNSLNGTLVGGSEVPRFQPVPIEAGVSLMLGTVTLAVSRLSDRSVEP